MYSAPLRQVMGFLGANEAKHSAEIIVRAAKETEVPRARLEKRVVILGKAAERLWERVAAVGNGIQAKDLEKQQFRRWRPSSPPLLPSELQQGSYEKVKQVYRIPKRSMGIPLPAPVSNEHEHEHAPALTYPVVEAVLGGLFRSRGDEIRLEQLLNALPGSHAMEELMPFIDVLYSRDMVLVQDGVLHQLW